MDVGSAFAEYFGTKRVSGKKKRRPRGLDSCNDSGNLLYFLAPSPVSRSDLPYFPVSSSLLSSSCPIFLHFLFPSYRGHFYRPSFPPLFFPVSLPPVPLRLLFPRRLCLRPSSMSTLSLSTALPPLSTSGRRQPSIYASCQFYPSFHTSCCSNARSPWTFLSLSLLSRPVPLSSSFFSFFSIFLPATSPRPTGLTAARASDHAPRTPSCKERRVLRIEKLADFCALVPVLFFHPLPLRYSVLSPFCLVLPSPPPSKVRRLLIATRVVFGMWVNEKLFNPSATTCYASHAVALCYRSVLYSRWSILIFKCNCFSRLFVF